MSLIPIKKYVAITSAVADTQNVGYKELIARVLTTNNRFAANTVYEFTSSADVSDFAGALSQEAAIASAYFGWISKKATQAKKISFMRYSFDALAPYMYSVKTLAPIAELKAVTDGSMIVNLGGTAYTISSINLSSIETYVDVATALQTAIQANTSGGALWTAATVTYDAANSAFQLTGGETGTAQIGYATAADEGTDLAQLIGWDSAGAPILSPGTEAQTAAGILNNTINISNNFLTVGFVSASDAYDNLAAIGAWTTEQNNSYRFCFDLGASNYQEGIQVAAQYDGLCANYNINYGVASQVPAWVMSAILPATTNYDTPNGVKSYMYQQFDSFPVSVGLNDETIDYKTLDGLSINYNGQTQKSGMFVAFYQDGYNTNGTDTAVFDNEAHLKDCIETDILNTQLALDFIPANNDGIATITSILQDNCDKAVTNGTISAGKTLSNTQKAYITQLTNNEEAWRNVQNNGYYYTVNISTETQGDKVIFKAVYTLIYSKNDTIRKVEGSNILI